MENNCAVKLLILMLLAVLLSPSFAASADNIDKALDQYERGLKAFKDRNWEVARKYFAESFRYAPESLSAFMLSQAYCQQDNRPKALEYANKALEHSPPLPEKYLAVIDKTIQWARSKETSEESRWRGIMSVDRIDTIDTEQKVFTRPTNGQGIRVDWCRLFATDCGEGAATAFCQMNGFQRAISFQIENDIGSSSPTYIIGADKLCKEQFCDGFRFIVCEK